MILLFCFYFII